MFHHAAFMLGVYAKVYDNKCEIDFSDCKRTIYRFISKNRTVHIDKMKLKKR